MPDPLRLQSYKQPTPNPAPPADPYAGLGNEDLDALLKGAHADLAHADELSKSVPARFGGTGVNASGADPAHPWWKAGEPAPEKPIENESLWGKIKRVANFSPTPTDIGRRFSEDVDPQSERDARANKGEPWTTGDTVKSTLANFGGDVVVPQLRAATTPAGAVTALQPGGALGRLLTGAASGVFAGEGGEQAFDKSLSTGERVTGGVNGLLGLLGLAGAAHGHAPEQVRTGAGAHGEFSPVDLKEPPPPPTPPPAAPIPVERIPPQDAAWKTRQTLADTLAPPAAGTFAEPHAPNTSAPRPELPPAAPADVHPPAYDRFMPNTSARDVAPVAEPELTPPASDVADAPPVAAENPLKRLFSKPKIPASVVHEAVTRGEPILDSPATMREVAAQEAGNRPMTGENATPEEKAAASRAHRDSALLDQEYRRHIEGDEPRTPRAPSNAPVDLSGDLSGSPTPEVAPPQSIGEMLRASMADILAGKVKAGTIQDAQRTAAGTHPGPEAAPPGREGHFTLPKPRAVLDSAGLDNLERRQGITESPLAQADRGPDRRGVNTSTRGSTPGGGLSERFKQEFGDETGAIDPELLKLLARPAIGAAVGGTFGNPEHRGRDALIGAGLGAASHIVSPERLRYASMLTGTAQAKNIVGDLGVVGHTAAERLLTHGPKDAGNVLREFFSPQTARDYGNMLRGKEDVSLARLDRPESASPKGVTGLPFRSMGAADTATQNALTRAGVEDAATRTFTGDPKTDIGKAAMNFQRKGGTTARALIPFMKTAVNQAEAAVLPFRDFKDAVTPMARRSAGAKIGLLSAGAAAGGAYGSTDFAKEHPKTSALISALAGPAQVPFALGTATAAAIKAKKSPIDVLVALTKAAEHQLPLPSDWSIDPRQWMKSLVPAGLDLVNPDPQAGNRDTTGGLFDAALSRLPGVSSTLPLKSSGRTHAKYKNE